MNKKLDQFLATRRRVIQGGAALGATSMLGGYAMAAPDTPINFIGWGFAPEKVESNVNVFKKMMDENVNYELVAGEYPVIVETRLAGGQEYDMMYAEEDRIGRWHAPGWIRDLEGLPGVDEVKAGMFPAAVSSMSLPDGRFAGMPYYAGHIAFLYNEETLDNNGMEIPTSLDELLDACRKLKKDGVSDAPYNGAWGQGWPQLSWSIFGSWYSEGAKVFDEDHNFVDEPAFRAVLEHYRALYAEGLVVEDIMTLPNEGLSSFCSGRHVFTTMHDYNHSVTNNPELSKIAGKVQNALMPGKTKNTFAWAAAYLMGANSDADRVWPMLQFFGGKLNGEYNVCKPWALEYGLGSGHKELMNDPEVVASYKKWRNLDISLDQLDRGIARTVAKQLWFSEWDLFMMQKVQDYIIGNGSTDGLVEQLADKAATLKAEYS